MIHQDERDLFNLLKRERPSSGFPGAETFVDHYADRLGMHWKREYYLLDKWTRKGWWNYGVSARGGWFEDKAPDHL